jgi:hypothetical protein
LVLFAAVDVWASSSRINPDGISYLDIGDAVFHGNWAAAVNPYFSPLYTLVVGAARRAFAVPLKFEYPFVHLVNFMIFIVVIACFEFFWGGVFRSDTNQEQFRRAEAAWWGVGYVVLAVTANMQEAIGMVAPDLMVTGILMLAAGMLLRVRSATAKAADYLGLGVTLGVGYLTKAPVFPISFLFFAAVAARGKIDRRHALRVCIMVMAFAIISLPLVLLLSKRVGRLTFGESGRLSWAWLVNGMNPPMLFWQGGPPSAGAPLHPPRLIWHRPDVYEFASPIQATYPLWYDPYYWHEGVHTYIDVRQMIPVILRNVKTYVRYFSSGFASSWGQRGYYLSLVTVLLFLALLADDFHGFFRHLWRHWPLLLIPLGALGIYSLVRIEPRYVAGYIILLFAPLFLATGAFSGNSAQIARAAAITLFITVLPALGRGVLQERQWVWGQDNVNLATAAQRAGLQPGDKIAFIGDANEASWAKLDKVSIVAEAPAHYWLTGDERVPVPKPFWLSSESEQAAILDIFKKLGVKAAVASTPSTGVPNGWQQLGNTLCIRFLR